MLTSRKLSMDARKDVLSEHTHSYRRFYSPHNTFANNKLSISNPDVSYLLISVWFCLVELKPKIQPNFTKVRNMWEKQLCRCQEGRECAPGVREETLLKPMVKPIVRQAVPLQSKEHPTPEQADAQRTLWPPSEVHIRAGSCQDTASAFSARTSNPLGYPERSNLLLKTCTTWKGPTLQQFLKNYSPQEGVMLEKCRGGLHTGVEEECEESSFWGGRHSRKCVMNWL